LISYHREALTAQHQRLRALLARYLPTYLNCKIIAFIIFITEPEFKDCKFAQSLSITFAFDTLRALTILLFSLLMPFLQLFIKQFLFLFSPPLLSE
jgi:hypothetical protein